jgi:tRNA U34 5-methylaminomethyl-2-thiouridine-forming methyltransferase MnmC
MQRKVVLTADGSRTIHIEEWNENYHSHHGALQEARHVFIEKIKERIGDRTEISILETGFGTGLNAFLALQLSEELNVKIKYVGLEAFPVSAEELEALNYSQFWEAGRRKYEMLHEIPWEKEMAITENFQLTKKQISFEDWQVERNTFDFIFFDAFGPRVQPHLWTILIFEKMFLASKKEGFFLTYCAKGQVRRDLESVGFEMKRLLGPPGKREMLVGKK